MECIYKIKKVYFCGLDLGERQNVEKHNKEIDRLCLALEK